MTDIAIASTAYKDREAGEDLAIVRAEGQFSGFHNCTAVVCVFPD